MGVDGPKPNPAQSGKSPTLNGASGAGAVGGGGLAAWWRQLASRHGSTVQQHVNNIASTVKVRAHAMKWSMPVDVKASPYVGVAVGSGLVVFLLQQRRVNYHRGQEMELKGQVKALSKDKDDLLKRINLIKARSGTPRSDIETRMAVAVAEATNAAAAAADAAARAATACIIHRPPTSAAN